jgi:hypothetical protein
MDNEVLKAIRERRSIRRFRGEQIKDEELQAVLEALSLKLDFTKLDADFMKVASAPVFQRLGYLLDCVLGEESIADSLHALMKAGGMKMKAVPLRLGTSVDNAKWTRNGK